MVDLNLSNTNGVKFTHQNPNINIINTEIKGYKHSTSESMFGTGEHSFYGICTISNCNIGNSSIFDGKNIFKEGSNVNIINNYVANIFEQEFVSNNNIVFENNSTLNIENNKIKRNNNARNNQ